MLRTLRRHVQCAGVAICLDGIVKLAVGAQQMDYLGTLNHPAYRGVYASHSCLITMANLCGPFVISVVGDMLLLAFRSTATELYVSATDPQKAKRSLVGCWDRMLRLARAARDVSAACSMMIAPLRGIHPDLPHFG